MTKIRVVARLDVKNDFVIKGIHFDGLRKIGNPNNIARKYYLQGVDEIIFIDAVASYFGRNSLYDVIKSTCADVFVPITVGGGIKTLGEITLAFESGADKVAINTAGVHNPQLLVEASEKYGSQSIISSIVAKKVASQKWEVFTENGREPTGLDVIEWARQVEKLGVGEILLSSVDRDGTKKGFDIDLCQQVMNCVEIPVILSGGAGSVNDIVKLSELVKPSAIAVGSILHYDISNVPSIKSSLFTNGHSVRGVK